MSQEAERWAWEQAWCGGTEKLVLVALARHARGWVTTVGSMVIAADCGMDIQAVRRAMRRLAETSFVNVPKRGTVELNHERSKVNVPELRSEAVEIKTERSNVNVRELGEKVSPASPSLAPGSLPAPSLQPPDTHPLLPLPKAAATPRWIELFNAFNPVNGNGRPHKHTPLTADHIATIQRKYGHLDLEEQVMRFVDHFTHNPQQTWAGYSRLSKWLEIAENKRLKAQGERNGYGNSARVGVTANGSAAGAGQTPPVKFPGMEQFAVRPGWREPRAAAAIP